ncbi:interferon-induced protein 44 isoform X2 [Etheostoma spectabile]|uniref:interferon-induced protein 44 isoform X2 n=1 Tax=Etheostoma spectabile TaxID=54343 RepID=UPI0013AED56E|nr:interferon-induced protein 44-like isoform X2 [Etheostoma spectabile]
MAFLQKLILSKPWREINWRDKQRDLQYVRNYKPKTEGQLLRILLHGPAGAGKSSFINSVQSVLLGRMYTLALAANTFSGCFTKKYTTYKIKKGAETFYPFVFNDIMGLGPTIGVQVKDVNLAMKGKVKEGYKFNRDARMPEEGPFYNKQPTDNDKVHVLVCVIDANTLTCMNKDTEEKIRQIRIEATHLSIPQVAILTKIDLVCPEIQNNLRKVYETIHIKNKMKEFSAAVGIPMNCIFPVKNYHEEIDLDNDVDSLILSALRNIINLGNDYFNSKRSDSDNSREPPPDFIDEPAPPYTKWQ